VKEPKALQVIFKLCFWLSIGGLTAWCWSLHWAFGLFVGSGLVVCWAMLVVILRAVTDELEKEEADHESDEECVAPDVFALREVARLAYTHATGVPGGWDDVGAWLSELADNWQERAQ
jgi:hypothetical protein